MGVPVLVTADHGTVEKWYYPDGSIDTDNYIWNAYLYPVFYWLGGRKNKFPTINFNGQNHIRLVIENRPIRMIYALLVG